MSRNRLMAFDGCEQATLLLVLVTARIGDVHIAKVATAPTEDFKFTGRKQASASMTVSRSYER